MASNAATDCASVAKDHMRMDKLLDTAKFHNGKATYQLDHKHRNGKHFVTITQTSAGRWEEKKVEMHIPPSAIQDLTELLIMFSKNMPKRQLDGTDHISNDVREKIKEAYLKGVPMSDLLIRFDQSEELIKKVLLAEGVAIVEGAAAKPYGKYGKPSRWH
jgi:hypothetical protein